MSLAEDMEIIRIAELDIELLSRDNDKLCAENNEEIANLEEKIKSTEFIMEEELKKSGEDKIECKFDGYKGAIGWQKQPDEWKRNNVDLMTWVKSLPKDLTKLFLKIVINLNWADLKKRIVLDNETYFENGKMTDEGLKKILYLKHGEGDSDMGQAYDIKGITIKRQDPKFKYSIKKVKA